MATKKWESTVIRKKVLWFLSKNKMFTSVDVGNSIKTDGRNFIRNREVAEWLRRNFMRVSHDSGYTYNTTMITVDNRQKAYLYHPSNKSADDYLDRDQKAKSKLG